MTHTRDAWVQAIQSGFDWDKLPKGVSLPEAVLAGQMLFVDHVLQSSTVSAYLAELPKGPGTFCPASELKDIVSYLAARRATVDKSDPLVTLGFIQELVMPAMEFEHFIANKVAELSSDVTLAEKIMLRHGATIMAPDINRLWLRWFKQMVVPYQLLPADERGIWDKVFEDKLPKYDYTVFDLGPDYTIINRLPWAVAFPAEIAAICAGLAQFKSLLQEDANFDQPETMQFLDVLMAAYACTEIEQLEERWAEVDRTWVVIPPDGCRTLLTYGMESGYEHPRGVSPEARVDVRTLKDHDLIKRVQAEVVAYTEQTHPEDLGLYLQKLSLIDIGIFAAVIGSGVQANFHFLGQAVPNRQEIMTDVGGRIFVDNNGLQISADRLNELINQHCTPEAASLLNPLVTAHAVEIFTFGHEDSHPAARTKESDQKLGEAFRLLEECKASTHGELSTYLANPDYGPTIVAHFIGRMLRMLSKNMMENPVMAAYVRDALAHATMMLGSGVITLTEKGISVNLEEAVVRAWFKDLEDFMAQVIAAYHEADGRKLEILTGRYCDYSFVTRSAKLIKWINREK